MIFSLFVSNENNSILLLSLPVSICDCFQAISADLRRSNEELSSITNQAHLPSSTVSECEKKFLRQTSNILNAIASRVESVIAQYRPPMTTMMTTTTTMTTMMALPAASSTRFEIEALKGILRAEKLLEHLQLAVGSI